MSKELLKIELLNLQNKLYRYALSIVFEQDLAKDIVQEVLLKLWTQKNQLKMIQNLEAWAIRLTRNLAYDKLKAANRKTLDIEAANYQLSTTACPNQIAEENDIIESIKKLMEDLPEKQKEIFRLRDLLGYSNKEIEAILALNNNQVKVNLFRARQKIKSKLSQLINYGLDR